MCGKLRAFLSRKLSPRRSGADAEPRPPARPPVHTELDKPSLEGAYWQEPVTVCGKLRACFAVSCARRSWGQVEAELSGVDGQLEHARAQVRRSACRSPY